MLSTLYLLVGSNPELPLYDNGIVNCGIFAAADKLSEAFYCSEQPSYNSIFLEKWFSFFCYVDKTSFVKRWMPIKYCCLIWC